VQGFDEGRAKKRDQSVEPFPFGKRTASGSTTIAVHDACHPFAGRVVIRFAKRRSERPAPWASDARLVLTDE